MCKLCQSPHAIVVKKGFYQKKKSRSVQRYQCRTCGRSFSDQTNAPSYRLKKSHVRNRLLQLMCSGMSQRRAARYLGIHQDTVASLIARMAKTARQKNLAEAKRRKPTVIVFDEMETFEHSKCKPVSITVAVEEGTRFIHALDAAQMPAKGRLAEISRKKYGKRKDLRPQSLKKTLTELKSFAGLTRIKSDESPRYPKYLKSCLPEIPHTSYKGRRGCVVGQGELKRGGFDPLFSLNHTCATIRCNLKRLTRKTWCTTKKVECLQMTLELVRWYFNQTLAGIEWPRLY
jgi:transposase-like protein